MKKFFTLGFLFALLQMNAAITQIRWGSTAGPLDGLTLDWTNTGTADRIRWGYTNSYEMGDFSTVRRNGISAGSNFFRYAFPVVQPNSTIYYQLYDSSTGQWISGRTYKTTPPANTENFSFIAQGDSRSNMATVWKNISQKVLNKNASFTLFTGDITNSGNNIQQYTDWFTNAADYVGSNIVYHSQGNHDVPSSVTYYQNIFALPSNNPQNSNLYYSFRYGNALFISLNSEDVMSDTSPQSVWLKSTLENAKDDTSIKWRIVFFHKSLVNAGAHYGDANARRASWGKWFDDYNVDLVLNGHDHNYQRSHPLTFDAAGKVTKVEQYGTAEGQGICQMICGGSGAGLYAKGTNADVPLTSVFYQGFNYVLINIEGPKLTAKTYVLGSTTVGNEAESILETTVLDKNSAVLGTDNQRMNVSKLTISENPVAANLIFNYTSDQSEQLLVEIRDMSARLIKTFKENKKTGTMAQSYDVSSLKPGIYNLSVIQGQTKQNTIFIKK